MRNFLVGRRFPSTAEYKQTFYKGGIKLPSTDPLHNCKHYPASSLADHGFKSESSHLVTSVSKQYMQPFVEQRSTDMALLSVIATLLVLVAAAVSSAPAVVENSHSPAKASTTASSRALKHLSSRQVFVNFDFDVLGIAQAISGTVSVAMNRKAFVKNLAYTAYYKAGAKYNVIVFDLLVPHEARLIGVKSYGSAEYHGTTYGIWVFRSGSFVNNGDCSAVNWGFLECPHGDGGYVSFVCDSDA